MKSLFVVCVITLLVTNFLFAGINEDINKAKGFFDKGKYFKAVEIYKNVLKNNTEIGEDIKFNVYNGLALSYYYNWDISQAIKIFKEILDKFQKVKYRETAYKWIAQIYFTKRDFKESMKYYLILTKDFKDSKDYYDYILKLGECYLKTGDNLKAKEIFQDILDNCSELKLVNRARLLLKKIK